MPCSPSPRESLLSAFCGHQARLNPPVGSPGHWDTALLVTGLDLHVPGGGVSTLGLAPVGGACTRGHNCVVGGLGCTALHYTALHCTLCSVV